MEAFMVLGFEGILREALKIFFKNKILMACLTLLILSFNSVFFLYNSHSIKPFESDLFLKLGLLPYTKPKTSEYFSLLTALKEDIRAYVVLEWIFFLISIVPSLFLSTATVIAPAFIHGRNFLSFREMLWSTLSSLKRPSFTYFYETLLSFGYIFLVLANLVPFLLLVRDPIASTVLVLMIVILASVLYIYLEVTWSLGFIVSVLEEKSGSEAIGKAAKIVKGRRLHGFLLNLVFRILSLVIYVGAMLVNQIKAGTVNPVIIGLFVTIVVSLVDMLRLMAYTILYYQCKKNHGEEVELPWRKGYSKVGSSLPLVNIENNGP